MSKKEELLELIDKFPDYKIQYIIAYVRKLTDDENDDALCESLYQEYLNDPDNTEEYSLEDCKKEWGIN